MIFRKLNAHYGIFINAKKRLTRKRAVSRSIWRFIETRQEWRGLWDRYRPLMVIQPQGKQSGRGSYDRSYFAVIALLVNRGAYSGWCYFVI